MARRTLALLAAVAATACVGVSSAQATQLNVWGTSDISDSHLLAGLIIPGFAAYDPGDTIDYTAVGSGAAIKEAETAANGVDVILVHSPSAEAPFVAGGYSAEPLGRAIFYNDYVIVGPKSDPAGVLANFPHDAVGAFQAIAAAGAAGQATFLSRDDASGTNVKEQQIWGQTTTVPKFEVGAGPPPEYTPSADGMTAPVPSWYGETMDNQGANLVATNTCNTAIYTNGNCYTIVDRGTYYYEQSLGNTNNLEIVSQNNASTAVGGASELTNPFHAYIVSSSTNKIAATRFLNFLTSPGFQSSLVG